MNTSITNNDVQQLIPMAILSSINGNQITNSDKSEIKQETFFIRLFSCPTNIFRFSDRSLRITFLLFITLIGLTSFTTALIVGSSTLHFKQQCPLYASFKYIKETNSTIKILPSSARFSLQSTCDFCTFYNVFTFIYCIMTGFFFVLFNGDQRIVTTNDRCLIIPWFPISIVLGLMALINASILTNGFLKFCSTMTSNNGQITSCTQINQLFFEDYPNVSYFFIYMLIAIIGAWFQLVFFIGVVAILTIRLGTSFEINNKSIDEKI